MDIKIYVKKGTFGSIIKVTEDGREIVNNEFNGPTSIELNNLDFKIGRIKNYVSVESWRNEKTGRKGDVILNYYMHTNNTKIEITEDVYMALIKEAGWIDKDDDLEEFDNE